MKREVKLNNIFTELRGREVNIFLLPPQGFDPDSQDSRDMWGFGGDLLPYWQLFESQVGGGFVRFVVPVHRNVGHW